MVHVIVPAARYSETPLVRKMSNLTESPKTKGHCAGPFTRLSSWPYTKQHTLTLTRR